MLRRCLVSAPGAIPRAGRGAIAIGGLAIAVLALGCGYQPVLTHAPTQVPLHVALTQSLIADPVAADEALQGLREALAERGALADGEGFPRVELEVLRVDELADGIDEGPGQPEARALRTSVVARAGIRSGRGAPISADTGDVRASVTQAPQARAAGHAFALAQGQRAAARKVGHLLGEHLLGTPIVSDSYEGR